MTSSRVASAKCDSPLRAVAPCGRLRDTTPADFAAILSLNAESVDVLSPLGADALARLHRQSARHRVIERDSRIEAFLLALREGADYDSPNYRWFDARYAPFLYIDRIVVGRAAQGRGLGARLYADLFDFAASSGVTRLACEYDIAPPNPVSARFHAAHGFGQVGTQTLAGGKRVSLQLRDAGPPA